MLLWYSHWAWVCRVSCIMSCVALPLTPHRGCDIQVCIDGNFGHKHNVTGGDCPPIVKYKPKYFVPASFVDAVDVALKQAGQRPPRVYSGRVPQEVVDECRDTHTAADGSRVKAGGDAHDDRGLMAVVCRHDFPLLACNIDTPGEQSKYAIALILWLMIHLPDHATAVFLYDIACVTARTLDLVRTDRPAGPLANADNLTVRHLRPFDRTAPGVLHSCNALVRAYVDLSSILRAAFPTRPRSDGRRGCRATLVTPVQVDSNLATRSCKFCSPARPNSTNPLHSYDALIAGHTKPTHVRVTGHATNA